MANQFKIIDEKSWDRAMHCMIFRNSVEPAFCVTFEADITSFREKVKEQKLSFTMAMVYAVCKCANEIEAFRYRFADGQIVLYDKIDTAFTYLNQETGLFKVVNVPMTDGLKEYCELAGKTADEQKVYFTGPLGNDVFQCSPMPWVVRRRIEIGFNSEFNSRRLPIRSRSNIYDCTHISEQPHIIVALFGSRNYPVLKQGHDLFRLRNNRELKSQPFEP